MHPKYLVADDGGILNTLTGKCVGSVDADGFLRSYSGPMDVLDLLLATQPLKAGDYVQVTP